MNRQKDPQERPESRISSSLVGNTKMLVLALLAGVSLNVSCSREREVEELERKIAIINQELMDNLETCRGLRSGDEKLGVREISRFKLRLGEIKAMKERMEKLADSRDLDDLRRLKKISSQLSDTVLPRMDELSACIQDFCFDMDGRNLCVEAEKVEEKVEEMEGLILGTQKILDNLSELFVADGETLRLVEQALSEKEKILGLLRDTYNDALNINSLLTDLENIGLKGESLENLREKVSGQLMMLKVFIEAIDASQDEPPSLSSGIA